MLRPINIFVLASLFQCAAINTDFTFSHTSGNALPSAHDRRDIDFIHRNALEENFNMHAHTPDHVQYRAIDSISREVVLKYISRVIETATSENDRNNYKQTAVSKLFLDNSPNRLSIQDIFEKLSVATLTVRNLTLLIGLVYLDRLGEVLHIFPTSANTRRLFGASVIVASKMHDCEVTREALAMALGLTEPDLLEVETALVTALNDLSVHPDVLKTYIQNLSYSKSSPLLGTSKAPVKYASDSSDSPRYISYQ